MIFGTNWNYMKWFWGFMVYPIFLVVTLDRRKKQEAFHQITEFNQHRIGMDAL